jgi:hypothetical protein
MRRAIRRGQPAAQFPRVESRRQLGGHLREGRMQRNVDRIELQ